MRVCAVHSLLNAALDAMNTLLPGCLQMLIVIAHICSLCKFPHVARLDVDVDRHSKPPVQFLRRTRPLVVLMAAIATTMASPSLACETAGRAL